MQGFRSKKKFQEIKTDTYRTNLNSHHSPDTNASKEVAPKNIMLVIMMGLMTVGGLSSAPSALAMSTIEPVPVNKARTTVKKRIVRKNEAVVQDKGEINPWSTPYPTDSMKGLIEKKQRKYRNQLSIEEKRSVISNPSILSKIDIGSMYPTKAISFDEWLNTSSYRKQEVINYQRFLVGYVGKGNVPPMAQLLTTARDWQACGYDPYQLPPRELWGNMVDTLRLYATLKQRGILPSTAEIRSVYRPEELNRCAGGSSGSKHLSNGAIDIWVPEYDEKPEYIYSMQNNLCQYWIYEGESFNFGLGLYPTGSVHIDTQGYRKWGASHTMDSSPCRVILPKAPVQLEGFE